MFYHTDFLFFYRNSKDKSKLSFVEWNKYLDEIAHYKNADGNALRAKLIDCGKPGFTGATVNYYFINLSKKVFL